MPDALHIDISEATREFKCKSLLNRSISKPNGCMIWSGHINQYGYPWASVFNKWTPLHRFIAQSAQPIDKRNIDGLVVMHTCDDPACNKS